MEDWFRSRLERVKAWRFDELRPRRLRGREAAEAESDPDLKAAHTKLSDATNAMYQIMLLAFTGDEGEVDGGLTVGEFNTRGSELEAQINRAAQALVILEATRPA